MTDLAPVASEQEENDEFLGLFFYRTGGPFYRFIQNLQRRREGKRPFTREDLRHPILPRRVRRASP